MRTLCHPVNNSRGIRKWSVVGEDRDLGGGDEGVIKGNPAQTQMDLGQMVV